MAVSIRRLSRVPESPRCNRLFAVMSRSIASSTVTVGEAIKAWWTSDMPSTFEPIMEKTSLLEVTGISTESSPSGPMPNCVWLSSKASQRRPFRCTSRRPNSVLTIDKISSTKPYSGCSEKTLCRPVCFL